MTDIRIVAVDTLDLRLEPRAWPWAERKRGTIEAHFEQVRLRQPAIWNGRVLLLHRRVIEGSVLRGAYFETDFASFLCWRDSGFPDSSVHNCFAMAALRSSDGAFLLGRMAAHTANAGKIYFPSGTPDPGDLLADGTVDLAGSVRRELLEETGLIASDVRVESQWKAVFAGPLIALLRPLSANEDAETLRARMRVHLARSLRSELADIVIVRSRADLSPAMPAFIRIYLEAELDQRVGVGM
jgi:8-oxo-dGTP pyrophosphatase MutT (NUDIX family)